MPKIIVEANPSGDASGERTFSERVLTQNLHSGHYSRQLLERMKWAVADAEAVEAGPVADPEATGPVADAEAVEAGPVDDAARPG